MAKLIVVWGKNGAGKSVTAANLSYTLAKQNKLVGLISANLWYGEIQSLLGEIVPSSKGMWQLLEDKTKSKDLFYCTNLEKNLFILSAPDGYQGLLGDFFTDSLVEDLLDQADVDFDYLIVDGSGDLNNPLSIVALKKANLVLNLARPMALTVIWHNAMRDIIKHLNLEPKLQTVINAYDGTFEKDLVIPSFEKKRGNKILELPLVEKMPHYLNGGILAVNADKKYNAAMVSLTAKILEL